MLTDRAESRTCSPKRQSLDSDAKARKGTAGMAEHAIDVEGLVREYKKGPRAGSGIDIYVEKGEDYGVLGRNGAGESTTVKMLVTLLPPSGGRATVGGFDIARQGDEVRRVIGVALQEAALDPLLTGREHLYLQA